MIIEPYEHIQEFEGLQVVDYQPGSNPGSCPRVFQLWAEPHAEPEPPSSVRKLAAVAVLGLCVLGGLLWSWWALLLALVVVPVLLEPRRERLDVDEVSEHWTAFLADPNLDEVQALVIGPWFSEIDEGPEDVIEQLVAHAAELPNLRAIYFGDIVAEECEISWITQGNLAPLLHGFPNLEVLVVRGGNALRFEELKHTNLRKLTVQSGGLPTVVLHDLAAASLPGLEHLELWLGDPTYGFEATIEDLRPLWQPAMFPALKSLGLRNAQITDDIATALAVEDRAVARLERLDLSLGTLSDLGAEALFNNPALLQVEALDLRHHYMSDDWAAKLAGMPIEVDVSESQLRDHPNSVEWDERYVAIGE